MNETQLHQAFPFSAKRIVPGSVRALIAAIVLSVLVLSAHAWLRPKTLGLTQDNFDLLIAALFLLGWIAALGKVLLELASYLLSRYFVEGRAVHLENGIFGNEAETVSLNQSSEVVISQSQWEQFFGLSNLKVMQTRKRGPAVILRGLDQADAPKLRDHLIQIASLNAQPSHSFSPNDERKKEGEPMANTEKPEEKESEVALERLHEEKSELDRRRKNAELELEKLRAKAAEKKKIEMARQERQQSAEALERSRAELAKAKEDGKEEERLEQTKSELQKAKQKLELLREERRTKSELQKVKDELRRESIEN